MRHMLLLTTALLMFAPGQESEAAGGGSPQTFGQKAVGLSFNPSGDDAVGEAKQNYADIIDQMNDLRNRPDASSEQKRLASVAITEAQGAQMWAVKALTWKD